MKNDNFWNILRALGFIGLFFILPVRAQLLKDFEVKESRQRDRYGESIWELKYLGSNVTRLQSIGGKPLLLTLQSLVDKDKASLFRLDYDAGIMGTRILSHMKRSLVLRIQNKEAIAHLDFLLEIDRKYLGKDHSLETRDFEWKNGTLSMGSIEEEAPKRYRWTGDSFVLIP